MTDMPMSEQDARRTVAHFIRPQLGGCEFVYQFSTKRTANAAIIRLATCQEHGGCHHFAVIGEGRTIAFSMSARECLARSGVI